METKLKVLKAWNANFPVTDSLSKYAVKNLKHANFLKSKKLIDKVWTYRGEVYFTKPKCNIRYAATTHVLDEIEKSSSSRTDQVSNDLETDRLSA